jgi:hypothetical protein
MSIDDDEDSVPDNLGSIGEQDTAPADPPRVATPGEPWPPPVPSAAEVPAGALAPPGGIVTHRVLPAPGEAENLAAIDANAAARHDTGEQAVGLATDRATDQAAQLQAEADLKVQQEKELADLKAQQQRNVDDAHRRDTTEYEKYRSMGLKDPDADASFGHRIGAALAIGLGQYSAAMNHTSNKAAEMFEQARRDNLELQRDKIERQKEASIKAGKDVQEAKADAAQALHNLQIKNVAQIDAFRSKFQAESARMGIPAARIQATALMQDTDRQALEARQKHLESQRSIGRDPTPKERGGGKGGGGGGQDSKLYDYLAQNPGDFGGVARLAAELHISPKRVDKVIGNAKGTESQNKDAQQSAVATRAIDEIEKSGYTPSKEAIQKWMDNQRKIALADKGGVLGGAAALGQSLGALPQSETEGLSPKAQAYFANTRRLMETIARKQSGAAISPSEWTNFFNQYGPNSKGGLAAAKKYIEDEGRTSGFAGRQVSAGQPKADAAPKDDAKPTVDRKALAREAIADPSAPPAVKARALAILRGP